MPLPELVPLTSPPAPIPAFEWAKLLIPPLGTGLVALLGAWVGFGLANRGRKYEIFYKERYKGFEELVGHTNSIISYCEKYMQILFEFKIDEDKSTDFPNLIAEMKIELDKIISSQPNNKYLVLQDTQSKSLYGFAIRKLENFREAIDYKSNNPKDESFYFIIPSVCSRHNTSLQEIYLQCSSFQNHIFKALELPKR